VTTVLTRMIHLNNDHKDPNESGCNETMQCSGCGGSMRRELILELFEKTLRSIQDGGQVIDVAPAANCLSLARTWGSFGERDSDRRKAMVMPPGTRPGRSGRSAQQFVRPKLREAVL
jgi:hypothetical protein